MTYTWVLRVATLVALWTEAAVAFDEIPSQGTLPVSGGRALNLDFETGTLADWTAEGDAFQGQPVEGDLVSRRRGDMKSGHAGRFWVGGFELKGDAAVGTLTSRPFRADRPFASFLVGGGSGEGTCVEIVAVDRDQVIFRASGDNSEEMERVIVDLRQVQGRELVVRLVDRSRAGWGHVNFDDFRLHHVPPRIPQRRRPADLDPVLHSGLGPQEAARAMTLPQGFQATLFAGEPDVVQPIAMAIDDRGRLWVAEAYSYPRKVAPDQARDRILIFEDSNGDGRFDSRKVFIEKLNLVSGIEVGFGGVWVGQAPELLFIPDRDGDDKPDGPPEVVLDGWGSEDTHETLNSFTWGPDGWLYGCHGVFTHSRVGKPGASDQERIPLNAAVWRYHPRKKRFEVFAHGTSNPWGLDWDERGRMFITACVIPHLYYVIQGGRYERQAGQHFNQYTYDDIKTIADHRHYLGGNPHAGNGRSSSAGGGHAHAGAMIYLGGDWPEQYRGSIFMNNIHGSRLNRDVFKPQGSGFIGMHADDFLLANDSWSQIVSIKQAPDGGVYLLDWYDKNQCHHNEVDVHDRTNGRIFKITYGPPRKEELSLATAESRDLVTELAGDEWKARHARRILQEREPNEETEDALEEMIEGFPPRPWVRLRALWTIHSTSGLSTRVIRIALDDPDPSIRGWAIRLAAEDGKPGPEVLKRYAAMAREDASPEVRLALASALARIPAVDRVPALEGLIARAGDAKDHNLPLMIWYAAEPLAEARPNAALALAEKSRIPLVTTFMARRLGSGSTESLALVLKAAARVGDSQRRLALLDGIAEARRGRRLAKPPEGWSQVAKTLDADPNLRVRFIARSLGASFSDPASIRALRAFVIDPKAGDLRKASLGLLVQLKDPELPTVLRDLVENGQAAADAPLRGAAVRGLAAFVDPGADRMLVRVYPRLSSAEKRDVLGTLAARTASARLLLEAIQAGSIPRADFTAELARQVANLGEPGLESLLSKVWGTVRKSSAERLQTIARFKALLARKPTRTPDPVLGRAVFAKICQQCHTLFGEGGKIGPDITGSNRADRDYLLSNVLDPSAVVGKEYQAQVLALADGRVLTGLIKAEDDAVVTLATATETITIPRADIENRKASDQSMMPDDLWKPLSEHEIRSLVEYLASPRQVPLPSARTTGAAP